MQAIKLFSQYDAASLFLKTRNELEGRVGLWPEEFLHSDELDLHIASLKETFRLELPEIDFGNGRQIIVDRILPLSDYQPGMRRGVNVRVSVLIYKYPLKGTAYLLGCCPPLSMPEPVGEWFTDTNNEEIYVEYGQYAKHPKKVVTAHQQYVTALQQAHRALKTEFEEFNETLDAVISEIVQRRKEDADHIRKMRMMLG